MVIEGVTCRSIWTTIKPNVSFVVKRLTLISWFTVSHYFSFLFCPVFLLASFSVLSYPLSSFFIPSLDMLATYSIIQDLIKCDIKKVTLRNERLLGVKRIPTSILQGSVPAMYVNVEFSWRFIQTVLLCLYKLECKKYREVSLYAHMNFNDISFSICRV